MVLPDMIQHHISSTLNAVHTDYTPVATSGQDGKATSNQSLNVIKITEKCAIDKKNLLIHVLLYTCFKVR